jgi:hypothetical protein
MLLLIFQTLSGSKEEERIDDDISATNFGLPSMSCIKVVASDKWLARIRRHFSNLPMIETRTFPASIAWYGDHAKFISGNIADVSTAYFDLWIAGGQ